MKIQALVLAAGMSTRFGNNHNNKLTIPLCGRPLIMYCINTLEKCGIPIIAIVGHQKEQVMQTINDYATSHITYAFQEEQRGTGHAVMCSNHLWQADTILILNGDMPLLSPSIIDTLCKQHTEHKAAVSFVTAIPDTPHHTYGRVISDEQRSIQIIENKDFKGDRTQKHPINAGVYIVQRSFLEEALANLTTHNASHEFYLTDIIAYASKKNVSIGTIEVPFDYVRGVNTSDEWSIAQEIKRMRIIIHWMHAGVRMIMPHTIHIDDTVTIEADTIIHAGVHLLGDTDIGSACIIEPYSIIENSTLADNVTIKAHSYISDASIATHACVGPFARLRDNTIVQAHADVGNFVEIARSTLGASSKVKHLTYLGDAITGSHVNIGAGSITCNYDGQNKYNTIIEDNVFIGSNNTLIAPLIIGKGAFTAAGSTLTNNVPPDALAIGRAQQMNKEDYAKKLRKKDVIIQERESNIEKTS